MKQQKVILQSVLFSFLLASTGLVWAQTPATTTTAVAAPTDTKEMMEKKEAIKEHRKEHRAKRHEHKEMRAQHRAAHHAAMQEKKETKAAAQAVVAPAVAK